MDDFTVWDLHELGAEGKVLDSAITGDDWSYSDPVKTHLLESHDVMFIVKTMDVPDITWKLQGSPRYSDVWGDCDGERHVLGAGSVDKDMCDKPYHQMRVAYKSRFLGQVSAVSAWVLTR